METVTCNFCGESENKPLFTLPDYLLERPNVVTTLVQCSNCGLIYQNPRPTVDEIGKHYPDNYDPYDTLEDQRKSWLLDKAINYGISKRVRFVTKHKKHGRILDIGCATGTFLNGVRTRGNWDLFGVEPNSYAAEEAKALTNANITIGNFEEARYPEIFFDAITMWDVLEHLHYPQETLNEIYRILKPGGVVVIRVPNVDSLQAKMFKQFWTGLDAPRHLYVFSPETLSNMLRTSGFEITHSSYNSASYLILVLSIRFWMVSRGINKQTQEKILVFLNHPISRLITAPFFYVAGLLWHGPSMVITGQKN